MTDMAISVERLNELIHLFGETQKNAMRAERREALRSILFDLARRSPLGWRCLYEHQVPFLREIAQLTTPDEVGRRMRGLGRRPYAIQPFILMCSHFGWRQQLLLDAGLTEGEPFAADNPVDLAFLCDFWARVMAGYRQDGLLLPEQTDLSCQILDAAELELLDRGTAGGGSNDLPLVRRMAATLELYNFVLHGEQRDGIFGHGPYELPDGSTLFVREFNDLRNDYLPWAATPTRNPWDAVMIAYRGRDVAVHCDLFGSMTVTPHEFADRVQGICVLGRREDDAAPTPLSAEDVAAVQSAAADAQEELYLAALGWDDHYKIAYGAPLFANHLWPMAKLAGADRELGDRLLAACNETAEQHTDELLAGEVPSVWAHMGAYPGEMYWPVVLGA
jgi:hypothetical protein